MEKRSAVKKNYNGSRLSILASYIKPHKKLFIIDMVISVVIALVDLIFPYITRWTMYTLLPAEAFKTFFIVMAILIAAYVAKAALYAMVTKLGHTMGIRCEADMRADIFAHLEELSFDYYDKNRTGSLLGRVTNDLFEITELAHHGPENVITCTLTIVGAIIIMLTMNIKLGLVMLVLIPVCICFAAFAKRKMEEASVAVKQSTGVINSSIESSITGIRTSKAFANEKIEERKFAKTNKEYVNSKKDFFYWMGVTNGGTEGMLGLMQVVVIAFGGLLIMKGEMNYIDLITFTLYVTTFTTPIRKLMQSFEIFSQGFAGLDRFIAVMRTQPTVTDSDDALELESVKGHIRYENVSFSYDDKVKVLENINVDIKPGKTLALVGSSGGGKTTFCHLLPRFYDVTDGRITIDGIDIRDVTQSSLRKNIGIIQQDVFLFADSIMENIRYGRPDATDEEVVEAAKLAQIHEEIMQMPDKYDTFVGERGVVLSGGQKQRISIARVFLKNPKILILDEATSALDSVTERQIQEALNALSVGKTTIVIAHRLSTIHGADCIALVAGSHIAEMGTRKELLSKNGAYAALERAQEL